MRIDRADHIAAAVQVKHRASRVGTRRRHPFRFDAARVHRFALDVRGYRKHPCHLLEVRARLLDRRTARDRLRLEHLDNLLELLLRHRFNLRWSFADYNSALRESASAGIPPLLWRGCPDASAR